MEIIWRLAKSRQTGTNWPIAMLRRRAHVEAMTERATKRPTGFVKPAHWSNAPVPAPQAPKDEPDPRGLSPTRYGDWEQNGIAVDF